MKEERREMMTGRPCSPCAGVSDRQLSTYDGRLGLPVVPCTASKQSIRSFLIAEYCGISFLTPQMAVDKEHATRQTHMPECVRKALHCDVILILSLIRRIPGRPCFFLCLEVKICVFIRLLGF